MRDSTRSYLRDELYYFKENKKIIETFRMSVLHPYKESDSNIGGGRSNATSDPTSSAALKLATPTELKRTMETVRTIERLLEKCSDEHRDVICSKYIDGFKGKNNDQVATDVHLSASTVKRRDKEFLEMLRLDLGYA